MEKDINIKKNRRDKRELYKKERIEIISKLLKLMNLKSDNSILYTELQNNEILKNELRILTNNIKKIYKCSTWGYFVSLNKGEQGDEITLLKAIFKSDGYKIFSKDVTDEYNNIKKRYTRLYFNN